MYFEWKDEYRIGNELIDSQHQSLIQLVNQFYIAAEKDSVNSAELFDRLLDYTRFHFKDEEHLMETLKYPDFEIHRRTHQALIERVLELRQQFNIKNHKLTHEILAFLKMWLIMHIQEADKKIVQSA